MTAKCLLREREREREREKESEREKERERACRWDESVLYSETESLRARERERAKERASEREKGKEKDRAERLRCEDVAMEHRPKKCWPKVTEDVCPACSLKEKHHTNTHTHTHTHTHTPHDVCQK
jgi:phage-related minor tail protein